MFKELPFPGYPECANMETTVIATVGNCTTTLVDEFKAACLDTIKNYSTVFNKDSTLHQFLAQILYPALDADGPIPTPATVNPSSPIPPPGNNSDQEEKEQTGSDDNSLSSIPIWLWVVLAVNVVLTCAICGYCYQRRCMDGKRSRYDDDNSDRSSVYEYEDEDDDFDPNYRQKKNSRRIYSSDNDESDSNGDIFSVLDGPTVPQQTESHGSSFSVLDGYAVEPPENHQRISEDSFNGGEGFVAGDKSTKSSSRKARMAKKIRSRRHFAY
jgi:hypothetical protein